MFCLLSCQVCRLKFKTISQYFAHVEGWEHKQNMKTIFQAEADEVENEPVGFSSVLMNEFQRITKEDRSEPVIGLLHIVMCVTTRAYRKPLCVCTVCQRTFPAYDLIVHLCRPLHIKHTLMHQNPARLPFGWKGSECEKLLTSLAWEEEKAQAPEHMTIKIIDLPSWVFMRFSSDYTHVCDVLDEYFYDWQQEVPKLVTVDDLLESHTCPQLGLQFIVVYQNNRASGSLCLLCERIVHQVELSSHVFSFEHVKAFLHNAHPGSLDSEAKKTPDKLLDLAKQAAEIHPTGCIQKVPLSCHNCPYTYTHIVHLLQRQKKMDGEGPLIPGLPVGEKLVYASTSGQRATTSSATPTISTITAKPTAHISTATLPMSKSTTAIEATGAEGNGASTTSSATSTISKPTSATASKPSITTAEAMKSLWKDLDAQLVTGAASTAVSDSAADDPASGACHTAAVKHSGEVAPGTSKNTWETATNQLLLLSLAAAVASTCGNSAVEAPETTMRSKSRTKGPAVGLNFLVCVRYKKRNAIYCQLCENKAGSKHHRFGTQHRSNYVRLKRPELTTLPSDTELLKIATELAKKDTGDRTQMVTMKSEREYEELTKAQVPEALAKIKAILRQQRGSPSPSSTNPQPESLKRQNVSSVLTVSHHPDGNEPNQSPDPLATDSQSSLEHTLPPDTQSDSPHSSQDPRTQPGASWNAGTQPVAPWDTKTQPVAPLVSRPQPVAPWDTMTQQVSPENARTHPVAPPDPTTQPLAPLNSRTQAMAPPDRRTQPGAPLHPSTQPVVQQDNRTQPVANLDSRTQPANLLYPKTQPAQPGAPLHPKTLWRLRTTGALLHPKTQPGAPLDSRTQPVTLHETRTQPGAPLVLRPQPVAPGNARTHPVAPPDAMTQTVAPLNTRTQAVPPLHPKTQPGAPIHLKTQPVAPQDNRTQPGAPLDSRTQPVNPLHPKIHPGAPLHPKTQPAQPGAPLHPKPQPGAPLHPKTQPAQPGAPLHPKPHPGAPLHPKPQPGAPLHLMAQPGAPLHPNTQPGAPLHPNTQTGAHLDLRTQPVNPLHPKTQPAQPGAPLHLMAQPGAPLHPKTQPGAPLDPKTPPGAPLHLMAQPAQPGAPVHPNTPPGAPLNPKTQPVAPDNRTQPVTTLDLRTQPVTTLDLSTQPVALHDTRTQPVTLRDTRTQPVTLQDSIKHQGGPHCSREHQEAPPDPGRRQQAPLDSDTPAMAPQSSGTSQKAAQHPGIQPQNPEPREIIRIKLGETQKPLERPDRQTSLDPDSGHHQQPFVQPVRRCGSAGGLITSRVSCYLKVKLSEAERKQVVGLSSVLECQCGDVTERLFPFYMCRSCQETVQLKHICGHIISTDHQLKYMWKEFPHLMAEIRNQEDWNEKQKMEGSEMVVSKVAERERLCQMDAEVILLNKNLYHRVQVAPFIEGINILEDMWRQQTSSCPPADQQPPDQQSSQDPPHTEESSRPKETDKSRDPEATANEENARLKKSLIDTTRFKSVIVKTEPIPEPLTTVNTHNSKLRVTIKQEDHTRSCCSGLTEMKETVKHGLDYVSLNGDAEAVKRRRISKSPDGRGTHGSPSGPCSDISLPASECPSPQNQEVGMKVEPSHCPSPQHQEIRVKVEPISVPTTLISQVPHCEPSQMQHEKDLELNLECSPTDPASTQASPTPWFIEHSLLKREPQLECPTLQNQEARVKVEPSQFPSPQNQEVKVKVEPSHCPSPQNQEVSVKVETTSVPTTLISQVPRCEPSQMHPEGNFELVFNSLQTLASSSFDLECPPTKPASDASAEPSSSPWIIDFSLAKRVLQSIPSTLPGAKQASPPLKLTSVTAVPLSLAADEDLPSTDLEDELITSIVDKTTSSERAKEKKRRKKRNQRKNQKIRKEILGKAIVAMTSTSTHISVGRVKPRIRLDSTCRIPITKPNPNIDVLKCELATTEPADDDTMNYEKRKLVPVIVATKVVDEVQSPESRYTTVIQANTAQVLQASNTAVSPLQPASQQVNNGDYRINQPTIATVSPMAPHSKTHGTPVDPYGHFTHGYPPGTGTQNNYLRRGYPSGTGTQNNYFMHRYFPGTWTQNNNKTCGYPSGPWTQNYYFRHGYPPLTGTQNNGYPSGTGTQNNGYPSGTGTLNNGYPSGTGTQNNGYRSRMGSQNNSFTHGYWTHGSAGIHRAPEQHSVFSQYVNYSVPPPQMSGGICNTTNPPAGGAWPDMQRQQQLH